MPKPTRDTLLETAVRTAAEVPSVAPPKDYGKTGNWPFLNPESDPEKVKHHWLANGHGFLLFRVAPFMEAVAETPAGMKAFARMLDEYAGACAGRATPPLVCDLLVFVGGSGPTEDAAELLQALVDASPDPKLADRDPEPIGDSIPSAAKGSRVLITSPSAWGRVGTVTEDRPQNGGAFIRLDEADPGTEPKGFGYAEFVLRPFGADAAYCNSLK